MKRTVLLLPAILASVLCLAFPARAEAPPSSLRFRVDLTGCGEGVVSVTLDLEAGHRPLILGFDQAHTRGWEDLLSSRVEEVHALDERGDELVVTKEGNAWCVDHQGRITFRYLVRALGPTSSPSDTGPTLDSPETRLYFPQADGSRAYLPGYALFLRPKSFSVEQVSLDLELPPGWSVLLPVGKESLQLESLLANPLLAGELSLVERDAFRLAVPSRAAPPQAALDEFAEKVDVLLARLSSLLGGGEEAFGTETLLVLLGAEGGDPAGEVFRPSASFSGGTIAVAVPEGGLLSDRTLEAVSRGLSSSMLAKRLSLQDEAAWLTEGAAWYLQDLLPYEAGIWGATLAWERLNLVYESYRDLRTSRDVSLAEAGTGGREPETAGLLARGGAIACAALDAELRDIRPALGDLFSFLRELARLRENGIPPGNRELRSLLETWTGRDWSSFFEEYVEGSREIPVSAFSSLRIAPPRDGALTSQNPESPTSTSQWILLGVAVALVFLVPFVLEPYTMRPRRPGFLEKKLREED